MILILSILSCKVAQTQKTEITDCELISKIINQVGIIDEDKCDGFINIIADTSAALGTFQRLFLNKKISTHKLLDFVSCDNFNIVNGKKIKVKPYKYIQENSNSEFYKPMYVLEKDQFLEIFVSSINKSEDNLIINIDLNNKKFNYFIHFVFKLDKKFNLSDIKIIQYKPNKSRPNYKDLSKKYPTLKSKYWESFGLPDK